MTAERSLHMDSGQQLQHESEACWICLDSGPGLLQPCRCPRFAHPECLARWQLQSAGKEEELNCRFCSSSLPDWKPVLTPAGLKPSIPFVSVHYNGYVYRLRVKPGEEGKEQFRRQLHKITGMPMLECMQITFQCKAPGSSHDLSFKGLTAFDAAIHCAAVSAAERVHHRHKKGQRTSSRSTVAAAGAGTPNDSSSTPPSGRTSLKLMRCLGLCLERQHSGSSTADGEPTPAPPPSAPFPTTHTPVMERTQDTYTDSTPLIPHASELSAPAAPPLATQRQAHAPTRNCVSFDSIRHEVAHVVAIPAADAGAVPLRRVDSSVLISHVDEFVGAAPGSLPLAHPHCPGSSSSGGGGSTGRARGAAKETKVRTFFRRVFGAVGA